MTTGMPDSLVSQTMSTLSDIAAVIPLVIPSSVKTSTPGVMDGQKDCEDIFIVLTRHLGVLFT